MPIASREVTELFQGLRVLFNDATVQDIVATAADAMGIKALQNIGNIYPPPPPKRGQYKSPIRTKKQKAWFWANMRAAATGGNVAESLRGWKAAYKKVNGRKTLVVSATSHYKRTGTLVRSINYGVENNSGGVVLNVGPTMGRTVTETVNADYAQYVIGMPPPEGDQAAIHQDRWQPLQQAIEDMSDELFDIFEDNLIEQVRKRLKGHLYGVTGSAVK